MRLSILLKLPLAGDGPSDKIAYLRHLANLAALRASNIQRDFSCKLKACKLQLSMIFMHAHP